MDDNTTRNHRLMTAAQMAKFLQVTPQTIRKYGKNGTIGSYQPDGKGSTIRYYIKEES